MEAAWRAAPLIAFLLAATLRVDAEPLREVQSRLVIESAVFKDSLRDQASEVESDISAFLAENGNRYFSFLRWRSSGGPESAAGVLTLKMTEKKIPIGDEEGYRIYLHYEAQRRVEGSLTALEDPILPLEYSARSPGDCEARPEIYRSWEFNFPNHDAEKLIADLRCHVDRHFASDDFRKRLHLFLREIELLDDLIVDLEQERLVLPVKWDELKAGEDSVLRVEFESALPGESARPGKMELKPGFRASSEEWDNYIQCLLQLLWFKNIFINSPKPWDDNLPVVLDKRNRRRLQVFMEQYSKDLGARTATEP